MKLLHLFSFGLVLSSQSSFVASLKIPFKRAQTKTLIGTSSHSIGTLLAGASGDSNVGNVGNIRYTTNITINGKEVHVALDTGSSDLWVIPPGGIGQFNDTGIPLSLLYGDGTYGVKGTIGVAPFEFGPYKIEKQAFLNANKSTIGAMTSIGIYGLFGLGFDHPEASPINSAIEKKYGSSAKWGASVLQNIFNQNTSKPNFIGVDLARTEDLEGTAGGSFNIGDYDEEYAAVANASKLIQFPPNATRWTTLLEGIRVDGVALEIGSTTKGVPAGTAIALVDTGSPAGVFPTKIMQGIFSKIEGAAYDEATRYWIVPCNSTTNVEMVMGNQTFSIHPLDLTEVTWARISGKNYTVCTNSFSTQDNVGGNEFDLVLGDTFLRNVYSVYDFGDPAGSLNVPYMRFLSQIDHAKAAEQAIAVRNKAIVGIGPELPPKELLAILNNSTSTTSSASIPTGTVKTSVNIAPGDTFGAAETSDVARYAPVVLGLLAANLLVGLVLLVLGVINCVRRGTPREGKTVTKAPHYVPVRFQDDDTIPATYRDREVAYDSPYPKSITFILCVAIQILSYSGLAIIGIIILGNVPRFTPIDTHDVINRVVGASSATVSTANWILNRIRRNPTDPSPPAINLLLILFLSISYTVFVSLSKIGFLGFYVCSVAGPNTVDFAASMNAARSFVLGHTVNGTDLANITAWRCDATELVKVADNIFQNNCTAWHNSTYADISLFRGINSTDSDTLIPRQLKRGHFTEDPSFDINSFYLGSNTQRLRAPTIRNGIAIEPHSTGVKVITGVPQVPQLEPNKKVTISKTMAMELDVGCISLGVFAQTEVDSLGSWDRLHGGR